MTIQLQSRERQLAFNRLRWSETVSDPALGRLPHRFETNRHGQIVMTPPASGHHSQLQGETCFRLRQKLGGRALPECPISTLDGVRVADVGWYSDKRFAKVSGQVAFELAPEIAVEVISPSNSEEEIAEKRDLYFEAGAEEFWTCRDDGSLSFFLRENPGTAVERSAICPGFPVQIG